MLHSLVFWNNFVLEHKEGAYIESVKHNYNDCAFFKGQAVICSYGSIQRKNVLSLGGINRYVPIHECCKDYSNVWQRI